MHQEECVKHLRSDGARLAELAARGPLDAPVASCPGWILKDLVVHVGDVHRWAMTAARTAAQPDEEEIAALMPQDGSDLGAWLSAGVNDLAKTLLELDPQSPTWHPFPTERVAGLWPRRQMHETSMHRWDAEQAVDDLSPIHPAVAADGIDEYLDVMLPRRLVRDPAPLPAGSLQVRCTDTAGEWLVWNDGGRVSLRCDHSTADGSLQGPAEVVLLALWGRQPPDAGALSVAGDSDVVAAWLDLGG